MVFFAYIFMVQMRAMAFSQVFLEGAVSSFLKCQMLTSGYICQTAKTIRPSSCLWFFFHSGTNTKHCFHLKWRGGNESAPVLLTLSSPSHFSSNNELVCSRAAFLFKKCEHQAIFCMDTALQTRCIFSCRQTFRHPFKNGIFYIFKKSLWYIEKKRRILSRNMKV